MSPLLAPIAYQNSRFTGGALWAAIRTLIAGIPHGCKRSSQGEVHRAHRGHPERAGALGPRLRILSLGQPHRWGWRLRRHLERKPYPAWPWVLRSLWPAVPQGTRQASCQPPGAPATSAPTASTGGAFNWLSTHGPGSTTSACASGRTAWCVRSLLCSSSGAAAQRRCCPNGR
jgi:hypothetical protein